MKDEPSKLITEENLKKIAESTILIKSGAKALTHEEVLEIFKEAI